MALRSQKTGKQIPWTSGELKAGFLHFFEEYKRYPTATEIDSYPYLPSARTIERGHGGLVTLRKKLGLGDDHDFRIGGHSSKRARIINNRAHKVEQEVYQYLVERFGVQFVHREYFFMDDKRTRADFFVHDSLKGFCVDVFYPSTTRNLSGCINSKLTKYQPELMQQYPVIFLQMNKNISQTQINDLLKRKKKSLGKGQTVMDWKSFAEFCSTRKRLSVKGGM